MQYFPLFLLLLFCWVLIARSLTVLLHELGHAIPVLLLTKKRATIYIGSYGDSERSIKLNLGFLTIFFRNNPLKWGHGLCVPSAESVSVNKIIIYTLAGPITSLIIASISFYLAFTYNSHGFWKWFIIVFLSSAVIDLFINLIPNQKPIKLQKGGITYNDGYILKQLLSYKYLPKEYTDAVHLYNEGKFGEAAVIFEKILVTKKDENIFRLAISSYLQDKNYQKGKDISDAFALIGKLNSDDFSNMGLSYSQLGFYEEALELFDKSLEMNPDNKYSLNNKGYTLNMINKYEEAVTLFDKLIQTDETFAYSYNNRGLAKLKLGQTEEGLQDIQRSLELCPDNSYAYLNMGIYHFEKGEFNKALQQFLKAKELDSSTHMIDKHISDTQGKIEITLTDNNEVLNKGNLE